MHPSSNRSFLLLFMKIGGTVQGKLRTDTDVVVVVVVRGRMDTHVVVFVVVRRRTDVPLVVLVVARG